MTDFGFKKTKGEGAPTPKKDDFSDLPLGPVEISPMAERAIVERGKAHGFTDRSVPSKEPPARAKGQRRRRPAEPAPAQETLFIRAPQELADWFQNYVEERGYRAMWLALKDFRDMIEAGEQQPQKGRGKP